MKQYRITDGDFTLTDIPGYNENALNVAEHELEEYKGEEGNFKTAKIQERDVSEWRDIE